MSFSAEAKAEMCQSKLTQHCDLPAETYGLLLFGSVFSNREIRLTTGNAALSKRIPVMFDMLLQCSPVKRDHMAMDRSKEIFYIVDSDVIQRIFVYLGLDHKRSVGVRLNRALLEDDCCKAAFLRGAFLSGGSVTDPEKRYHLELVTPHYNLSREMLSLLMDMGFEPKITVRKSNYVIYFKFSESIEDFLTKAGAPVAAMHVMEAKVEKEVRNKVNRQVNCETANITKTVDASAEQIAAIRRLLDTDSLKSLPDNLRAVAEARLTYPELSLSALAALISPAISKASLNYRMNKLMEISKPNGTK